MATSVDDTHIRTFKNWNKKHLDATHQVNNLETDLCDGIKLNALVEAFAKKEIPGRVIRSENHIYWQPNVSLAWTF